MVSRAYTCQGRGDHADGAVDGAIPRRCPLLVCDIIDLSHDRAAPPELRYSEPHHDAAEPRVQAGVGRPSTPVIDQANCIDNGRDERRRGEGGEHGNGDQFHEAGVGLEDRLSAVRGELCGGNHDTHEADRRQAPGHAGLDAQSTISPFPSQLRRLELLARRDRRERRALGRRRRESAGCESDRKQERREHARRITRGKAGYKTARRSRGRTPLRSYAGPRRIWGRS